MFFRRGVRAVEGARLESVCTSKAYRGFESLPLRQSVSSKRPILRYMEKGVVCSVKIRLPSPEVSPHRQRNLCNPGWAPFFLSSSPTGLVSSVKSIPADRDHHRVWRNRHFEAVCTRNNPSFPSLNNVVRNQRGALEATSETRGIQSTSVLCLYRRTSNRHELLSQFRITQFVGDLGGGEMKKSLGAICV